MFPLSLLIKKKLVLITIYFFIQLVNFGCMVHIAGIRHDKGRKRIVGTIEVKWVWKGGR